MFKRPKPEDVAFFKFHPIQETNSLFNEKKVYFRVDDSKPEWISFNEEKREFYCSYCLAFSNTNNPSKFIIGMPINNHIYCRIDEHGDSKTHENSANPYFLKIQNKSIDVLLFSNQFKNKEER